ncbi:MAG: class I SAM-dependent methyltransferase [Nanoarchaeota archaeon]
MNDKEKTFFTAEELKFVDTTNLPFKYLMKCQLVKIRRFLWGRFFEKQPRRLVWGVREVSDVDGPNDNVRNYLERQIIRGVLKEITKENSFDNACEVGCGYGRVIMVLKEFAKNVVGFERESHLVEIGRGLLPEIKFYNCNSIDNLRQYDKSLFDLVLTDTVLQHLTDEFCKKVLTEIKTIAPQGYVLLIEKTEAIRVTKNIIDGNQFISIARPVELYKEWMRPYELITTKPLILENTYSNKSPGTCMLFRSPNFGINKKS